MRPALRWDRQKSHDPCDALTNGRAQGTPIRPARRLDVLQSHDLAGVRLAHGPAEKLLVMEDPDLGQVARIIAHGDGVADIGGQGRVAVA